MKLIKSNLIIKVIVIFGMYVHFTLLHLFFAFFKVKNNKIVVSNFYGKGYGDNPKYLVEELLKYNKLDIVWLIKKPKDLSIPSNIRQVKIFSVQSVYELLTGKVWIDNCRKYFFTIFLRKKRRYIYKRGMVELD